MEDPAMHPHRSEVDRLVDVLHSFPAEQQEALAAHYRAEAEHVRGMDDWLDALTPEQSQRLGALIQEGIEASEAGDVADGETFMGQLRAKIAHRR